MVNKKWYGTNLLPTFVIGLATIIENIKRNGLFVHSEILKIGGI
ncbi:hypothetical protein DSUL_20189 [Desulfovibrionales bacterium]